MKRFVLAILALLTMVTAIPAQAGEYTGYVRNWWVEANGDISYYFMNSGNTAGITGLCGANLYRLRATQGNYDELYSSLLLAAKNSYMVRMNVNSCTATINYIDTAKVCTWTSDC